MIARVALAVGVAAMLSSVYAIHHEDVRASRSTDRIEQVQAALQSIELRLAPLERKVAAARRPPSSPSGEVAAIARAALRSVFTIETTDGRLGSAFYAWGRDGNSYFVTANHVVANAEMQVRVMYNRGSWGGTVMKTDPTNDLALVEVDGSPSGLGRPLWPDPSFGKAPAVGDSVLLVGSPYGLEGTVTNGIVSRVTAKTIQTDAAANPGNSGGPMIDRFGRVLGVLVRGGGENINFAVPIALACVSIRDCATP